MRILSLIVISLLFISQVGCWNAREINELAFVLSLALDKADDGFLVTAQIAKAETYSKTPSGGASDTEKPFWIITGTGKTIFEAVRNMAATSPRRIFWSHIKVIIIGEELARSNIIEILDFFSRNPELRFRTWIAVTPGAAGKLLGIVPIMEKDPAQNIEKLIENTNLTGKAYSIMLKDFLEDYLNPYVNPVASRLVVTTRNNKPTIKLSGACVFGVNKMAGWLTETETRGLLWIKNQISGSVRVVNCPYDNLPVTLEIKKGETKFQSSVLNGIPHYTINASAAAKLTEQACLTGFTDPKKLQALEQALASDIQDDIQAAVTAAQNIEHDFLNFSGILHRTQKSEWDELAKHWPQRFKKAKVKIEVNVEIPEVSLLAKPLIPIKPDTEHARGRGADVQ